MFDEMKSQGSPASHPMQVDIYGMSWCAKTQMVRRFFDRKGIQYTYLDLEKNEDSEGKLRWITGGYLNHPTVVIDGQALIEPSISDLEMAVANH